MRFLAEQVEPSPLIVWVGKSLRGKQ